MIETIIILVIMVVILGYTTINLLVKNEKAEDIIVSQQKYISLISEIIKNSEKRLQEIDKKEIFKSDDEIGWFFNEVKKIQNILSQYKN
jgi:peptidoglycan hydrolase CwlO-like protein